MRLSYQSSGLDSGSLAALVLAFASYSDPGSGYAGLSKPLTGTGSVSFSLGQLRSVFDQAYAGNFSQAALAQDLFNSIESLYRSTYGSQYASASPTITLNYSGAVSGYYVPGGATRFGSVEMLFEPPVASGSPASVLFRGQDLGFTQADLVPSAKLESWLAKFQKWAGYDGRGNEVIGSKGDDTIHATGQNAYVDAGAGADVVYGTSNADTINGAAGDDRVYGNSGNDTLGGGDGSDYLDGGAGADRMAGGAGDDVYVVDDLADQVVEAKGEGIDAVFTNVSYTLSANVEDLYGIKPTTPVHDPSGVTGLWSNYFSDTSSQPWSIDENLPYPFPDEPGDNFWAGTYALDSSGRPLFLYEAATGAPVFYNADDNTFYAYRYRSVPGSDFANPPDTVALSAADKVIQIALDPNEVINGLISGDEYFASGVTNSLPNMAVLQFVPGTDHQIAAGDLLVYDSRTMTPVYAVEDVLPSASDAIWLASWDGNPINDWALESGAAFGKTAVHLYTVVDGTRVPINRFDDMVGFNAGAFDITTMQFGALSEFAPATSGTYRALTYYIGGDPNNGSSSVYDSNGRMVVYSDLTEGYGVIDREGHFTSIGPDAPAIDLYYGSDPYGYHFSGWGGTGTNLVPIEISVGENTYPEYARLQDGLIQIDEPNPEARVLIGNDLDNNIWGWGTLVGGAGNDVLITTDGRTANVLDGGSGADLMMGNLLGDVYVVDNLQDTVVDDETAIGFSFIDLLNSDERFDGYGKNTFAEYADWMMVGVSGYTMPDFIEGAVLDEGVTSFYGNASDSIVLTSTTNTTVDMGGGRDILITAEGSDTVIFDQKSYRSDGNLLVLAGYQSAQDKLVINLDADTGFLGGIKWGMFPTEDEPVDSIRIGQIGQSVIRQVAVDVQEFHERQYAASASIDYLSSEDNPDNPEPGSADNGYDDFIGNGVFLDSVEVGTRFAFNLDGLTLDGSTRSWDVALELPDSYFQSEASSSANLVFSSANGRAAGGAGNDVLVLQDSGQWGSGLGTANRIWAGTGNDLLMLGELINGSRDIMMHGQDGDDVIVIEASQVGQNQDENGFKSIVAKGGTGDDTFWIYLTPEDTDINWGNPQSLNLLGGRGVDSVVISESAHQGLAIIVAGKTYRDMIDVSGERDYSSSLVQPAQWLYATSVLAFDGDFSQRTGEGFDFYHYVENFVGTDQDDAFYLNAQPDWDNNDLTGVNNFSTDYKGSGVRAVMQEFVDLENNGQIGTDRQAINQMMFTPGYGSDVVRGNANGNWVTVNYSTLNESVDVNLAHGYAIKAQGANIDDLEGISAVIGTNYNDTLVGGDFATTRGGSAIEEFQGLAGNDYIKGGAVAANGEKLLGEYDRVSYTLSPTGVTVDLGAGTAKDGFGGTDTLVGINMVRGSSFNDTLIGSNASHTEFFEGREGNDIINGKNGETSDGLYASPYFHGDIVSFQDADQGITAYLGGEVATTSTTQTVKVKQGSKTVTKKITTTTQVYSDDALVKKLGLSFAGGGLQMADGYGTVDTIVFESSGGKIISSIEGVQGSDYADILVTSQFKAEGFVRGGAGSDVIVGLGGNDYVDYYTNPTGVFVDLSGYFMFGTSFYFDGTEQVWDFGAAEYRAIINEIYNSDWLQNKFADGVLALQVDQPLEYLATDANGNLQTPDYDLYSASTDGESSGSGGWLTSSSTGQNLYALAGATDAKGQPVFTTGFDGTSYYYKNSDGTYQYLNSTIEPVSANGTTSYVLRLDLNGTSVVLNNANLYIAYNATDVYGNAVSLDDFGNNQIYYRLPTTGTGASTRATTIDQSTGETLVNPRSFDAPWAPVISDSNGQGYGYVSRGFGFADDIHAAGSDPMSLKMGSDGAYVIQDAFGNDASLTVLNGDVQNYMMGYTGMGGQMNLVSSNDGAIQFDATNYAVELPLWADDQDTTLEFYDGATTEYLVLDKMVGPAEDLLANPNLAWSTYDGTLFGDLMKFSDAKNPLDGGLGIALEFYGGIVPNSDLDALDPNADHQVWQVYSDLMRSMESVQGSEYSDVLFGNMTADNGTKVLGRGGDDYIVATNADGSLYDGGAGADHFYLTYAWLLASEERTVGGANGPGMGDRGEALTIRLGDDFDVDAVYLKGQYDDATSKNSLDFTNLVQINIEQLGFGDQLVIENYYDRVEVGNQVINGQREYYLVGINEADDNVPDDLTDYFYLCTLEGAPAVSGSANLVGDASSYAPYLVTANLSPDFNAGLLNGQFLSDGQAPDLYDVYATHTALNDTDIIIDPNHNVPMIG